MQAIRARAISAPARLIGDSVFEQVQKIRSLVRAVLRSIARGWAFFKDIHFGWYVLVPVISSTSAFGDAAAIIAWSGIAILVLALLGFVAVDVYLGRANNALQSAPPSDARQPRVVSTPTLNRNRSGYEPLQSRLTRNGLRRNDARRPARSRVVGL
jgi:hypothetical protein